jgi:hypothetical protein
MMQLFKVAFEITNQVTPWNKVIRQILMVTQLVNKFSARYRAQRCSTLFTKARRWAPSRTRWPQSKFYFNIVV